MRTTTTPIPGLRRIPRFVLVGTVTAIVALGAAACGSGDDDGDAASDTSTTVAADSTGESSTESQTGGQSSSGGGGTQTGGGTGGGGAATPAPTIVSFETPENIDCHNSNSQTFTASWTTTNATRVTISIDGPGVYRTYDANGSDSLPFNCSSSHTFLLTAYGEDGQTATRSVTLEPRNVQTSTTEDQP